MQRVQTCPKCGVVVDLACHKCELGEMTDIALLGCIRAGLDKLGKENVLIRESADWALIQAELITLRNRLQKTYTKEWSPK